MHWRTAILVLWILGLSNGQAVFEVGAISVAPSQSWDGNDGPWSSFPIRIGTPAQNVNVFVSTAATATLVVGEAGCQGSGIPSNCTELRGGTFDSSSSTSWSQLGVGAYGLHLEDSLGFGADEGIFGFETVGLGFQGSGSPTLNRTVTAWIQTFDFVLGTFGLNPRPTNFSSFNDNQTSYLSLLKQGGYIPSLSYGYTAGAKYMYNSVLASLTLGGYDEALFSLDNSAWFAFYFDQERDLTVALQGILTSEGANLLPEGILTLIDSTVPQIWLPLEACQAFERAFGLVYDAISGFYLVNDTLHDSLLARNSNITFTLAPTLDSTSSHQVHITLPYKAFDLTLSYPWVQNTTRYFPLRRAANDTQYVLGRTFLQEAYIFVNYEENLFQVAQRTWSENVSSNIVSYHTLNTISNPSGSRLSKGVIAGIAIGALAVLAIISATIFFCLRKRRRGRKAASASAVLSARLAAESKKQENISLEQRGSGDAVHGVRSPISTEPGSQNGHSFYGSETDSTRAEERAYELSTGDFHELDASQVRLHPMGQHLLGVAPTPPITPVPTISISRLGTPSTVSPITTERGNWESAIDAAEDKSLAEIKEEPKSLRSMKEERARPFSWQLHNRSQNINEE